MSARQEQSPRDAETAAGPELAARLRALPSVDEVLRSPAGAGLLARHPRWAVVEAVRSEIAAGRARLLRDASGAPPDLDTAALERRIAALQLPHLRRVLNATGVVLHTNLGRAPLARRALERATAVATGYSTLELDPRTRARGSRHDAVRELLCQLTGAEAAAVVNNNAGAVLVALAALAAGREAVVSRGELVEIGGGFRVPDVMRSSGVRLVEVGTTNKTRLDDYLEVLGPDTALLLKVHRSNFAVVGFTEEASVAELARAARRSGLPLMVDLGSGSFVQTGDLGLPAEPTVQDTVAAGADLVTFSGDKLLGGPQAGILVGRQASVAAVAEHPMMRALRPDKLTLAALEATLEIYRDGNAREEIPTLRMLGLPDAELQRRAEALLGTLQAAGPALTARMVRLRSAVGGGALPLAEPETWAVGLRHRQLDAEEMAARLGASDPPLVGRISGDELLLDVRTLDGDDLAAAGEVATRALAGKVRA